MAFLRATRWLLTVVLATASAFAYADVYVSPAGNDSNSGSKENPFQTLVHARDFVRQQIKHSAATRSPVTVWLAGGDYPIDRTFELLQEDSGVENAPICYRAEPGAQVRLIGGRQIPSNAFKPVQDPTILNRLDASARGHVVQADLKSLGITNFGQVAVNGKRGELFFNDRPLTVARWPNQGFVKIVNVTTEQPIESHGIAGSKRGKFTYDGDRPNRWTEEKDIWLQGYWFWDWADQCEKVQSLDTNTKTITLVPPGHAYGYRKGQSYYALNVLAELDQPGEWYLDRQAGILYLWPPSSIEKARIVFSTLEAPVIQLKNASYAVLRGLTVETTRGDGIVVEGGQNNLIAGCTVRNVGSTAIVVSGGKHNGVAGCDVYEVNAGIRIYGGDRRTLTPAGNFASNNHIHHFARLQRTYMPAIDVGGVGNRADHNLVHDAPHWAISFGGNENVMEFNELHDVCQETGDVGVFYTGRDWTIRGNVIRNNFIHHVTGPGAGTGQGVYLDDCASGTIVRGNIIYKTSRAMLIGGGRDNVIENNIMFDCKESLSFDNRGLNWMKYHVVGPDACMPQRLAELPYRQPPWSERYPQLLKVLDDDPGCPKGNTVRWNVVGRSQPMSLADEVRRYGTIADNLTTDDLGFEDAAKMDFRLRKDSIVFQKLPKFESIPFEKIGLQVDEYRKTVPAR